MDIAEEQVKVGTLVITFHGAILKEGKPMTTTVTGWGEYGTITDWINKGVNVLSLAANGPKTWVSDKRLRLDSQPIASTSPYWNCAIQQNTKGGAKSESYTSVLIHSSCFQGGATANLAQAVERAHWESNRSRRIVHVDPDTNAQPVAVVVPQTQTVARTTACPKCNDPNGLLIPPQVHRGAYAECKVCNDWSEVPAEFID